MFHSFEHLRYPWDASFNIKSHEEQVTDFNNREIARLTDTLEWMEETVDFG